jgi:DNA-binding response OmpR family regulator
VRRALATDLRREGFDVSTAASLEQAREVVRTRRVHVIIADGHLPDPIEDDPLAVLARESPTSRRLVMSADPGSVRADDADHVLTKPWNRAELLQVTRRLCLRGERRPPRPSGDG